MHLICSSKLGLILISSVLLLSYVVPLRSDGRNTHAGFKAISITNWDKRYCGGYAVFARICGVINIQWDNLPAHINTSYDCCEEELVRNPKGFEKGDIITATFKRDCADVYIISDNTTLSLTGYVHFNVSISNSK